MSTYIYGDIHGPVCARMHKADQVLFSTGLCLRDIFHKKKKKE